MVHPSVVPAVAEEEFFALTMEEIIAYILLSDEYIAPEKGIVVLPKYKYSAGAANTCSICLSTLCINDEAATLKCGHVFHHRCIMKWLNRAPTCPNCRLRQ